MRPSWGHGERHPGQAAQAAPVRVCRCLAEVQAHSYLFVTEQFLICWASVVSGSNVFSVLHRSVMAQWFQQTWVQPVWFL